MTESHSPGPAVSTSPPLILLRIPGDHFYQGAIRRLVADAAHRAGFPSDAAAAIAMAVDEACANVVEHGYGGVPQPLRSPPPAIELQVEDHADRLVVSICDSASPYRLPAAHAELQLPGLSRPAPGEAESIRERGMGLLIIRRVMDEVQLAPLPAGGNCLRLTKYKAPAPALAGARPPGAAVQPETP